MSIANPSSIAEALPDPAQVKELKAKLDEQGVKYILSCWIDLLGVPKTKPVPISDFELLYAGKGPQRMKDIRYMPAWSRNLSRCAGRMVGRSRQWRTTRCPAPEPAPGTRPRRQAFGYDVEFSIDAMPFLGELIDILGALGWDLHDVVAEGAYSQFELDFHYTDVLGMADRLVFLRVLLKEIAKKHGMFVTYMPKPTTGDWRSGAHMNTSMQALAKPGTNVFEAGQGGWADPFFHAVGGLLRHGGALTAIACSTVNSYNGLVPKVGGFEGGTVTWAPTHMTYGYNNRSAMLRLPQSRFCIENRAADMCMNPYLALGMTTAAMVEGVKAALCADSVFNEGEYTTPPSIGLKAFARVYAGWAFSQTFFRMGLYRQLGFDTAEDLLRDWEEDHLCWDANDLLAKLWTWQRGDISANERYEGNFERALSAISARAIVVPCRTDLYFPPEDSANEVAHMPNAELRVFDSPWGHCVASPGNVPAFQHFLDACVCELLEA